jgi:hypothetical protein
MKGRHKQLELDDRTITRSNKIIEKALAGGRHLTREELIAHLKRAKIPTDNYRSLHLFLCAELDKIICSGAINGKKQTWGLLSERVPKAKSLKKEEALATLAKRYFTSHGPATLQDFAWWSGLSAKDSRDALEMIKKEFVSAKVSDQTYWMSNSNSIRKAIRTSVHLLPAYDEFTISYKDRSASLEADNHRTAISANGIFYPLIVVNGQVKGLWKRAIVKDNVMIELNPFSEMTRGGVKLIEHAANEYCRFIGKSLQLKLKPDDS